AVPAVEVAIEQLVASGWSAPSPAPRGVERVAFQLDDLAAASPSPLATAIIDRPDRACAGILLGFAAGDPASSNVALSRLLPAMSDYLRSRGTRLLVTTMTGTEPVGGAMFREAGFNEVHRDRDQVTLVLDL